MINNEENPVAWTLLLDELEEAKEHLTELTVAMQRGRLAESEFAVHMGHVYAHLNRAWNTHNQPSEIEKDQWDALSRFPKDLKPVG